MGESHEHQKRLLRRRIQAARSGLASAEVARLSAAACARLLALPVFAAARRIVLYAPMGNELDPGVIAERARLAGKSLYYPRSGDTEPGFVAADRSADSSPLQSAGDVLVLVPGIAFDPRGVRLGRGVGWYDRALAEHPDGVRLGLAYDFQVVRRLPEDPWDIRMHAVVTDARVLGEPSPIARAMKEGRT